ncbi:hypothetical protein VCRA2121O127_750001 [Vibrio crassostreae]|nr:hypothetical protein VCRA2119O124_660001 [Vibrio crassostreae]CAK3670328.1 hypothetical protein VCRA2121O127_750001 [Vibrio crassostreae]CAK3678128.1 hypothetical protein VCRA2120E126_750002 [Vibrio crassostreae]CAK3918868.1 hypothetical protein VCRA217O17_550001 [Vibrio crassostreae]
MAVLYSVYIGKHSADPNDFRSLISHFLSELIAQITIQVL